MLADNKLIVDASTRIVKQCYAGFVAYTSPRYGFSPKKRVQNKNHPFPQEIGTGIDFPLRNGVDINDLSIIITLVIWFVWMPAKYCNKET